MSRVKKLKRNDRRVVTYVRVTPEEHERIAVIAEERGYPHTISSVAAEMISRGLASEGTVA
jgi:Fe-S cluster assembly scaffold protein SufB